MRFCIDISGLPCSVPAPTGENVQPSYSHSTRMTLVEPFPKQQPNVRIEKPQNLNHGRMLMNALIRGMTLLAIPHWLILTSSSACTGIAIKPKDGSVIVARTLELASDIQSSIIVTFQGAKSTSAASRRQTGASLEVQVRGDGTNAYVEVFVDGVNEKGLSRRPVLLPRLRQLPERSAGRMKPKRLPRLNSAPTC